MMPDPSLDTFFFWNSGSEAVEAAIKVARAKTRRNNIIVMQGSNHGKLFASSSLLFYIDVRLIWLVFLVPCQVGHTVLPPSLVARLPSSEAQDR